MSLSYGNFEPNFEHLLICPDCTWDHLLLLFFFFDIGIPSIKFINVKL